ncbi:hypothetical protein Tco_0359951 [Tanacetum coccineum]
MIDLEDILQIQDVILHEKLLNISRGGLTSVVINEISDNLTNDPLLELPEFESFHVDPSFPHTPPEPPDVEISLIIETDGSEINVSQNVEDDDSFTFVLRTFSLCSQLTTGGFSFISPPGVKTPFLTPTSPLRAGGISSGWNFHVL